MFKQSKKAGKLWLDLLKKAELEDKFDEVYNDMEDSAELSGFESSDSVGGFLLELPNMAENLTFFFDPSDGAYGQWTQLSESELMSSLKEVGSKYNLI